MTRTLRALLALSLAVPAALAQSHLPPGTPYTTPDPNYPLQLHVISAERNHDRFGVHGFGRADLFGNPIRGLDYTLDCGEGFLHNADKNEFYQGRWKKPDQKMEILVQRIGSTKVDKCEIKVTMKAEPYGHYKTALAPPPPATTPPTP